METTIYEVKFKDGRIYRIFCYGKNQKKRFFKVVMLLTDQIEFVNPILNGIHTIQEFEKGNQLKLL
jgi:hypothetical protein